jgi:hypothetical protein
MMPTANWLDISITGGLWSNMSQRPNKRSALDARTARCFHMERHWPGASESER